MLFCTTFYTIAAALVSFSGIVMAARPTKACMIDKKTPGLTMAADCNNPPTYPGRLPGTAVYECFNNDFLFGTIYLSNLDLDKSTATVSLRSNFVKPSGDQYFAVQLNCKADIICPTCLEQSDTFYTPSQNDLNSFVTYNFGVHRCTCKEPRFTIMSVPVNAVCKQGPAPKAHP